MWATYKIIYIYFFYLFQSVHVDANSLALNVQDDTGGRVVTVMHPQNFPPQMCR